MTYLDVIDSAVKIGLGSALTIAGAHLSARGDWKRERHRRKLDALEELAADFETANNVIRDASRDVEERARSALSFNREDVDKPFARMRQLIGSVETRLQLMGMTDAIEKLRAYNSALHKFSVASIHPEKEDELKDATLHWARARSQFLQALAADYRSI
jgi:hypothetical protein